MKKMRMFIKTLIGSVTGKGLNKTFTGKDALGGDFVDRQFLQQSGFTSIPKEGAQGIIIKSGENHVCIATENQEGDVPELQNAGDVAIYSSSNYVIKISAAGEIEIKGNGNAGSIVLGTGVVDNLMKDTIISKFNSHTHTGGTIGGNTGTPNIGIFDSTDATTETKAS
jgi:phage gp45-like